MRSHLRHIVWLFLLLPLLLQAETVSIAVFDNAAPVIDIDDNRQPYGLFPDLLDRILGDLNYEVDFQLYDSFQDAYRAVDSGEADIMPALIRTAEREKDFRFNDEAFMVSWSEIYTAKGTEIDSILELRGKRIGLQEGGQNGKNFIELMSSFDLQFEAVFYPSLAHVSEAIISGEIYAGAFFSTYFRSDSRIKPTNIIFSPSEAYIGMNPTVDPALKRVIDQRLKELKEDDSSYYYSILADYLLIEKQAVVPRWAYLLLFVIIGVLALSLLFILVLRGSIRRVRRDLWNSEAKYTAMFNNSGMVMMLIDLKEQTISDANEAAVSFYGYEMGEFIGMPVEKLNATPGSSVAERLQQRLEGKRDQFHVQHMRKNGEIRHMEIFSTPLNLGQEQYIFAILNDETEKVDYDRRIEKEKQRTEEALKVKSEFLANISHELRTPLNGIIGMLSLLENLEINDEERYFLTMAQESSQHLFEIIRDILDFSRIDAGRLRLREELFDLGEAVEMSLGLLGPEAQKKRINLERHYDFTPDYYYGDRTRIIQILVNLISNGIKYSSQGTVRIDIERAGGLIISVQDRGIGMSSEETEKIFDSFRQLEDPYNKRFRGVGIGLSIVNELVSMMQGTIAVESSPGEGSTFTIRLPDTFREKPAEPERTSPASPGRNGMGHSILVVEDEAVNRLYLCRLLNSWGYRVEEAKNGEAAVSKAVELKPDLILMDISLPKMNGIDASRMILTLEGYEEVPIVALTAHAHTSDKRSFLEAGMRTVITKPFNEEELAQVLESFISP